MVEPSGDGPPSVRTDRAVPPPVPSTALPRPRVMEAIDAVVSTHRITVVSAPAGMGKTTALSQWAQSQDHPVVWLSLAGRPGDRRALYDTLAQELEALTGRRPAASAPPAPAGAPSSSRDRMLHAFNAVDFPVTLIIDDVHLAEPDDANALLDTGAPVQIVMAGRPAIGQELSRLRLYGSVGTIEAQTFAFTPDETRSLAGLLGTQASDRDLTEWHDLAAEWPVALHRTLQTRPRHEESRPDSPVMLGDPTLMDYLDHEILHQLPPAIREFILTVTTCDEVDAALATLLSDRGDSGGLLEACHRDGLFLERHLAVGDTPIYRWNPAFATLCRALERRPGADRSRQLHRRAASYLTPFRPAAAARHALQADDPGLAARIIEDSWLAIIIQANSEILAETCGLFPRPWNEDPAILMVRAACTDVSGDRVSGALLLDRAMALTLQTPAARQERLELMHALATLLVADDRDRLADAADRILVALHGDHDLSPTISASALFLVGWQNLRLRRDPAGVVDTLRAAVGACEMAGLSMVARRARSNLAFATAFAGDFTEAARLVATAPATTEAQTWRSVDGGQEVFTRGFLAYWSDDLPLAAEQFTLAIEEDGLQPTSWAGLSRVFLAWTAAALGDQPAMTHGEELLGDVRVGDVRGVPWGYYRSAAAARLAEARGDHLRALTLLTPLTDHAIVPMTATMIAEVWRRCGAHQEAMAIVDVLSRQAQASFLRSSLLLTHALVVADQGDAERAHTLLELSLGIAVPHTLRRHFIDAGPDLRPLLVAHVNRGTRHEAFVGDLLGRFSVSEPIPLATALSRREREIMGYLQTSMTNAEIAAAIFVSVNTLKTHKQAIFRKMGVTNRRDAVRTFAGGDRPADITRSG